MTKGVNNLILCEVGDTVMKLRKIVPEHDAVQESTDEIGSQVYIRIVSMIDWIICFENGGVKIIR